MKLPINIAKTFPSSKYYLLSISTAVVLSLIGIITGYFPGANDLFDNHYLAMAMNFSNIKSLYDGFFPIGYGLLLKIIVGDHYPAVAAFFVNVFLFLAMTIVMAWYLKKLDIRMLFPAWLILVFFLPQSFQYLLTPGPDAAAMALFTIGLVFQLARCDTADCNRQSNERGAARRTTIIMSVWGGMALGIAALIRYHAFPASMFLLLALFVFMKNERKLTFLSGIVVTIIYLPQMIISVLSGHGPFTTYHALNLCNLVHRVNWYHMGNLIPLPSAMSVIAEAPFSFVKHYLKGMFELSVFAIPPIAYGYYASLERRKNIGYGIGAFCLLYALVFGMSASPRAVLLIIPGSMLFFAKILFSPDIRVRTKRIAIIVTLLCGCIFLVKDAQRIAFCKRMDREYRNMEAFFIKNGVKNGRQVYTTDHNQYFQSLFPYRPLFNGGWGRIATYNYSEFYPELDVGSIDDFYDDCVNRNVRFVVLSPDAPQLADFCQGLYEESLYDERFEPVLTEGNDKVFRVVTDDEENLPAEKESATVSLPILLR